MAASLKLFKGVIKTSGNTADLSGDLESSFCYLATQIRQDGQIVLKIYIITINTITYEYSLINHAKL